MNTGAKIVIGLGILIIIIGIIIVATGDSFEDNAEEGIVYEGADGDVKIDAVEQNAETRYVVHLVNKEFEGGGGGGYNEAHGNQTWNLTQSDCDIVNSFSLRNEEIEMFYPRCNYIEDGTDDKYIIVGYLCNAPKYDRYGWEVGSEGEGCKRGEYTWNTEGNTVMVYDIEVLIGAFIEEALKWLGSFGACCCGSVILVIGIIMAAVMEDSNTNPYAQQTSSSEDNIQHGSSGWEDQKDYIYKQKDEVPDKSEIAVPEDENKDEKKRSGEYELPPPPEL